MKKTSLIIYPVLLITLFCYCTKPVQKSGAPSQAKPPDTTFTHITLECLQKSKEEHPFVELSLILHNTQEKHYIATVYGTIYQTFESPPPFAPPNTVCGVAISHKTTIHYFFVCVYQSSDTIRIQSAISAENNVTDIHAYSSIVRIPFEVHNRLQTHVIIITD